MARGGCYSLALLRNGAWGKFSGTKCAQKLKIKLFRYTKYPTLKNWTYSDVMKGSGRFR